MDATGIGKFLQRYGKALSTGDLKGVADAWEVPALVLSDEGAHPVAQLSEVRSFFSQAVAWYRERGQVETRPELQHLERLSGTLLQATVRWPAFDAAGRETASERSIYILRIGHDGQPRIRVAITAPAAPAAD